MGVFFPPVIITEWSLALQLLKKATRRGGGGGERGAESNDDRGRSVTANWHWSGTSREKSVQCVMQLVCWKAVELNVSLTTVCGVIVPDTVLAA